MFADSSRARRSPSKRSPCLSSTAGRVAAVDKKYGDVNPLRPVDMELSAGMDPDTPEDDNTEGVKTRKKLEAVHADALMEFNEIQGVLGEERRKNREDREFAFLAGAQRTGEIGRAHV